MTYWVKVRYNRTGTEATLNFDTALLRATGIIMLSPYATVLEQWEGLETQK